MNRAVYVFGEEVDEVGEEEKKIRQCCFAGCCAEKKDVSIEKQ